MNLLFRTIATTLVVLMPCFAQQPSEDETRNENPESTESGGWRRAGQPRESQRESAPAPPSQPAPSQLVVPAGTWLTVRVNQPLSSDQNRPGDTFTGTLAQPIIADGFVIARRGQTVGGRVADSQKAGRAKGTSRLGLELTEVSLVDGQQMPVVTQLMEYSGGASVGRDATAVATTTGLGAAIGGAAAGGVGAGAGAAAGAAASAIGVLLTRGRATVVYPEATLTFRIMSPLTINTERASHAYLQVGQGDYEPRLQRRTVGTLQTPPSYYYGGLGGPWFSPFYYGYGPSLFWYSSPRFYGGGYARGGFGRWGSRHRGR